MQLSRPKWHGYRYAKRLGCMIVAAVRTQLGSTGVIYDWVLQKLFKVERQLTYGQCITI